MIFHLLTINFEKYLTSFFIIHFLLDLYKQIVAYYFYPFCLTCSQIVFIIVGILHVKDHRFNYRKYKISFRICVNETMSEEHLD